VVAELLTVRSDLLAETNRRMVAERDYVLRHEIEPLKKAARWILGLVSSAGLLIFSWWLGKGAGV
jgi:hypothetical protein